jgi:hypothetical protein
MKAKRIATESFVEASRPVLSEAQIAVFRDPFSPQIPELGANPVVLANAASFGMTEVVQQQISQGVRPTDQDFINAAKGNHADILAIMLSTPEATADRNWMANALSIAVSNRSEEALRVLVTEPSMPGSEIRFALMQARARLGEKSAITRMIASHAPPEESRPGVRKTPQEEFNSSFEGLIARLPVTEGVDLVELRKHVNDVKFNYTIPENILNSLAFAQSGIEALQIAIDKHAIKMREEKKVFQSDLRRAGIDEDGDGDSAAINPKFLQAAVRKFLNTVQKAKEPEIQELVELINSEKLSTKVNVIIANKKSDQVMLLNELDSDWEDAIDDLSKVKNDLGFLKRSLETDAMTKVNAGGY